MVCGESLFLLDLKIIVLTILKVFKTEGINHVGHVTMERFTGEKIEIKGRENENFNNRMWWA